MVELTKLFLGGWWKFAFNLCSVHCIARYSILVPSGGPWSDFNQILKTCWGLQWGNPTSEESQIFTRKCTWWTGDERIERDKDGEGRVTEREKRKTTECKLSDQSNQQQDEIQLKSSLKVIMHGVNDYNTRHDRVLYKTSAPPCVNCFTVIPLEIFYDHQTWNCLQAIITNPYSLLLTSMSYGPSGHGGVTKQYNPTRWLGHHGCDQGWDIPTRWLQVKWSKLM